MIDGFSIEGFAIVSRDGMLAGTDGLMPDSLKFDEDQQFLDEALDAATLLINGKMSHERQDNSHKRKRLLLTRTPNGFSTTPVEPNTWLWCPKSTPLADACKAIGITPGVVAILGGTAAYDLFLPHYAKFHLAIAMHVDLAGGVPVFGAVREGNPPAVVLQEAGMKLADQAYLNKDASLVRETFLRDD